jgi:hypothetical protein
MHIYVHRGAPGQIIHFLSKKILENYTEFLLSLPPPRAHSAQGAILWHRVRRKLATRTMHLECYSTFKAEF